MRCILVLLSLIVSSSCWGAVFTEGSTSGLKWIFVSGKIEASDDQIFMEKTSGIDKLFVYLESPGGLVDPGLHIGRIIHERQYTTVVASDMDCVSICGAMWLGGAERFVGKNTRIGFHAAFTDTNGVIELSQYANESLKIYYNDEIGLADSTRAYLMAAGPRDITWLRPQDAASHDIAFSFDPKAAVPAHGTTKAHTVDVSPANQSGALTPEEVTIAASLTHQFNQRFEQAGMPGMAESIEKCYSAAAFKQTMRAAVYCAGLDVLVMIVSDKTARAQRVGVDRQYNQNSVLQRIDALAGSLGFSSPALRARGTAIALYAASQSDTTADPLRPVHVSFMEAKPHVGLSVQSPGLCLSMTQKISQLSNDFGGALRSFFCGRE